MSDLGTSESRFEAYRIARKHVESIEGCNLIHINQADHSWQEDNDKDCQHHYFTVHMYQVKPITA